MVNKTLKACDVCGKQFAPRYRQGQMWRNGELVGKTRIHYTNCKDCATRVFWREELPFDLENEAIRLIECSEYEWNEAIELSKYPEIIGSTASEYTKRISRGITLAN